MKMIKVKRDLTGKRFGRLTVIKQVEDHVQKSGRHESQWLCKCDCGNETMVTGSHLVWNDTESCGCKAKEASSKTIKRISTIHGMTGNRLHKRWIHMRGRCRNKKDLSYGGRGIKVCDEWENDFMSFYNWAIANGWKENAGLTIDRIDNNGDYEPSNCRWVTVREQNRNKRGCMPITYNNQTKLLVDWERETGLPIGARLKGGWSIEKAFTTPKMPHKINKKKVGC